MKKLLCLGLCVVTLAAVFAFGQEKKKERRQRDRANKARRVDDRDPFGTATPAKRPNPVNERDPFAAPPQDKSPTADPVGGTAAQDRQRDQITPRAGLSPTTLAASAARKRIELALSQETTFDYLDQPLSEVVEDVGFSHKIPIVLDKKALDDFGIDTSTPITINIKGVSLRSAFRLMLDQLDLTYLIRDEVLMITTLEEAQTSQQVRLYPVSDLLPQDKAGDWLTEMMTTIVKPESWDASGGAGSVIYVDHLEVLIVRQSEDVLHEIDELLAALKSLRKSEIGL